MQESTHPDGDPAQPTRVSTLLGEAQAPHALPCLASLLRNCVDPVRLLLHDDGTLSPSSAQRLLAELPGSRVVPRAAADELLAPLLAAYPRLAELRKLNPLFLKLLDVAILGSRPTAFVDADVLFLRPFSGLFRLPAWADSAYMRDVQHAYSVTFWRALTSGFRLAGHVNTGVILARGEVDLDALEWFVGQPGFGSPVVWAEQTAWAFLAAQGSAAHVDPAQLTYPGKERPETIGIHFISPLRAQLAQFLDDRRSATPGAPVAARFIPTDSLNPVGLACSQIWQRLKRQWPFRRRFHPLT